MYTAERLMYSISEEGWQMQTSITNDANTEHDLHVMEGLIQRLAWSYNSGGMELVRAEIGDLARFLNAESREPAVWVLDEWLAAQVQRAA
jgi:hypothetical protein